MGNDSELEIELTLESGLVVDFVPDFRVQTNTSDQTQVSWRLPSSRDALNVGVLCDEFPDEGSTDTTIFSSTDV